ncbi:WD40/YVTN/BNR-like repeat-containing protein, partial [Pseudomonas gingeri]
MTGPFHWLALGVLGISLAAQAGEAAVSDVLLRPARQASAPTRAVLIDIARAGQRLVAVGEHGLILLSDDSGQHWRQAVVPTSVSLTAVSFPTAEQGWAVGHAGMVLHSADGGESWSVQLDGNAAAQRVLDALADKSNDTPQYQRQLKAARVFVAEGADKPLLAVHFTDERVGTVVGAFGLILHTTDGGVTWQSWVDRLDNPAGNHLYAIASQGARIYVAGEQGLVLMSEDAGAHFVRLPSPYEGSFFTLNLSSDGDVLVAGLRGNAWHSRDQGQHWAQLDNPFGSSLMAARSLENGGVVLADQSGRLLSGSEDGPLREQSPPAGMAVASLIRAPDGRWVVV